MTETPIPVQFDPETLETARRRLRGPRDADHRPPASRSGDQGHAQLRGQARPAQPVPVLPRRSRRDRARGDRADPGQGARLHALVRAHERWIVLAEFPFVVNPLRLALSGRPYIENYRWKPELGTRFTLRRPRRPARRRARSRPTPFFGFHHVNAYEEGDELVVDICVFEDARIDRGPLPGAAARRASRSPSRSCGASGSSRRPARSTTSGWSSGGFELPRINYGRCNERPYRYAWGVGERRRPAGWSGSSRPTSSAGDDLDVGRSRAAFPGEPVFVAAPGRRGRGRGRSALRRARLRPRRLVPARARRRRRSRSCARAEAPHHIPFGFHGQFASTV